MTSIAYLMSTDAGLLLTRVNFSSLLIPAPGLRPAARSGPATSALSGALSGGALSAVPPG